MTLIQSIITHLLLNGPAAGTAHLSRELSTTGPAIKRAANMSSGLLETHGMHIALNPGSLWQSVTWAKNNGHIDRMDLDTRQERRWADAQQRAGY